MNFSAKEAREMADYNNSPKIAFNRQMTLVMDKINDAVQAGEYSVFFFISEEIAKHLQDEGGYKVKKTDDSEGIACYEISW